MNAQFESLMKDRDIVDETRELIVTGHLKQASEFPTELFEQRLEPRVSALESAARPAPGPAGLEAIVLTNGRPTLLVQNGTFEVPTSTIWRDSLSLHKGNIETAIARVGRVELVNHLNYDWVGTGWLIADGVIITNRHVAQTFSRGNQVDGFTFAKNILQKEIGASVDFREEYEIAMSVSVAVDKILYVAGPDEPDIALLRIRGDVPLPEPLALAENDIDDRQEIGVIGYPAHDTRNGQDDMSRIFGDIYDVKRFAPGKVSFRTDEHYFVHDCTTLGGNSGSSVIDLETGHVVGLHFSGSYLEGNFAVKVAHIKSALSQIDTRISVPSPGLEAIADGRHEAEFFAGRDGYQSDFLGATDDLQVPLPELGDWEGDVARQDDGDAVLTYRHFSVVVSSKRKLPLLAAVNINGAEARRAFRSSDRWFVDKRIDEELQLGNEIYRGNDLDRGHMVRRLDPVWGEPDEAQEANDDTFHYLNAAPQHKDLNRREWVNLEDFVLDSAKARDLKVSVFSGPVFADNDRPYRGLVKLPKEFWKIAVLVHADTNKLSAAGYVLTQGHMIRDITEVAFVFGEFRTFQVPIATIEASTGLDFGRLKDVDTLSSQLEIPGAPRIRRIDGSDDISF